MRICKQGGIHDLELSKETSPIHGDLWDAYTLSPEGGELLKDILGYYLKNPSKVPIKKKPVCTCEI